MRYKVKVADLQTGMYVTELDRSWVGTPFLFQGFLIESNEELSQLKSVCQFVIVDEAQSRVPVAQVGEGANAGTATAAKTDPATLNLASHRAEPLTATHAAAQTNINGLFAEATQSHDLLTKVKESQAVVLRLVHQSANPNLMMQQANLRVAQDRNTGHALNTAILAIAFGRHLGHSEDRLKLLGLGAILHDIGKVRIPAEILNKPTKLTEEEFGVIKRHPAEGYDLLKTLDSIPTEVLDMVRYHHERLDGTGYPQGLKAEEIPQSASIIALADAYDTLTTVNPYQAALTPLGALQRLRTTGSTGFGQELLQEFMRFFGAYPVGSLVKLTSNDLAVVYSSDPSKRLRPLVMVVRDGQGKAVHPHRMVNLSLLPTEKLSIATVLDPGQHAMDISKLFAQELGKSV